MAKNEFNILAVNEPEVESKKKKTGSGIRIVNFIARIVCLLAAIGIWFYVQDYDSPTYEKKFTNIPVSIQGSASGFTVLSGYDNNIDVTVKGRKSDISKLKLSDITASIDISNVTEAGNISCPVDVILPSGLEVSELSSTNFWLYIDKRATANITVYPSYTGYTESGLIVGNIAASPSSITVSGPEAVLKSISGAYCSLELDKITGSVTARETIVLRDANGDEITNPYVAIGTKEVMLTLPVYKEAVIPIKAQFIGGVHSLNEATVKAEPSTITVRGTVEAMEDIYELLVDVDESKIPGSGTVSVPITLPKGVESVSSETVVKLNVTLHNNRMRTMALGNIQAVNVPEGMYYSLSATALTVNLRGTQQSLDAFYPTMLSAKVDLSVLEGNRSGEYQLLVEIDTNFQNTGVYVFGEYKINVTISEEPIVPPEPEVPVDESVEA